MDRISTYLEEDEVDEQVSSLKRGAVPPSDEDEGLGIVNGTFKWNEVEETKDADKNKAAASQPSSPSDETDTAVDSQSTAGDHRFELRDINVMFPEGELTVITGPTASGKTALLVRVLGAVNAARALTACGADGTAGRADEAGRAHCDGEEPGKGGRARLAACDLVRRADAVAAAPVHQGQYLVRLPV